jgi:putative GTP pyrophosphokinase
MQHAWAEIEHDIRYKSKLAIPSSISRRFIALAGLLEIADREFQAIQEDDASLRAAARTLIDLGRLDEVEVTADALHAYLDARLGPDDRISDSTYEGMAEMLTEIGFQSLNQVDECIAGLDDKLSRIVRSTRTGQITRFEILVAASMGENYLESHPWANYDWFQSIVRTWRDRLQKSGIVIGSHHPTKG